MISKIKDKIRYINERNNWYTAISIAASKCNGETFSPLKNKYVGKSVVVCGAGPSLNNYNPIEGAVHIALNRALLYEKVKFDYFFADDWDGINFMQEEINNYKCEKFLGYRCGGMSFREIPESFRIKNNAKKYYTDSYIFPTPQNSKLVIDIDKMPISNAYNMGLQIMQIALFTNPSTIYLVGIDADASGHFSYKGLSDEKSKKIDKELKEYVDIKKMKDKWLEIKELRDVYYPDTKIISINPVGLKGIFIDQYQNE